MTGRQLWKVRDRFWVYPFIEDVMVEAGLQESETYVSCHQNIVMQYITTRTIMDLCLAAKQRPGTRVEIRWWKQEGFYLEGMQTAAWEAEQTEGVRGEGQDGDCNGRLVKWGGYCSSHKLRDR